ncbi:hypothetical protein BASA81_011037 [Batrachochytrium salamandrivorans]|nr:hypothetical protein BASA81_011037 [Batrachochytrium salamandrivorans]
MSHSPLSTDQVSVSPRTVDKPSSPRMFSTLLQPRTPAVLPVFGSRAQKRRQSGPSAEQLKARQERARTRFAQAQALHHATMQRWLAGAVDLL